MYVYKTLYVPDRDFSDYYAGDFTNVILYHDNTEIGRWTYINQPWWLKRRIKILEKKYGAKYER